jgi:hypothetical protein
MLSAGAHVVLCLNKDTKERLHVGVSDILMTGGKEVSLKEHVTHMFMPTNWAANPLWDSCMLEDWQRPYVEGPSKVKLTS